MAADAPTESGEGAAVSTVLVVGAGTMGAGIAQVAAVGGFRTLLQDADPRQVERALRRVEADFEKGQKLGKVTPEARQAALVRLESRADLEAAAAEADFV